MAMIFNYLQYGVTPGSLQPQGPCKKNNTSLNSESLVADDYYRVLAQDVAVLRLRACVVCDRVRRPVRGAVLGDGVPEAVPLLLPEVLRDVPVRAGGHLRQQEHLPLLQQLEDQEGRPQVPLVGLLIRGST